MKKKSKVGKVLGILSLTLLGGLMGFMIGKMSSSASTIPVPLGVKLAILALLIPAFLIAIAWHEGGHAVAGIKMGFDFRMYIVGPFMWEKETTGWHFKWNKNVNTAGGMVMCLPLDTVNLPNRFSVFAAGGPIASLVLTVLSYGIYALGFKNNPTSNLNIEVVGSFFLFTAYLSLFFFITTSIPIHMGGFYTDGARILRLQKGGDKARFDSLLLKLVIHASSGTRPKLLNINEIEEAQAIAQRINEPFGVYLHSYLHQAAFDNGDIEKAEKHLLDYVNEAENIPDGIRNIVWLDAAFFYAFGKKDLAEAENFLNQFKPSPIIPKAQVLATEAALSFLKNDKEAVILKTDMALKELPNMIDQGVAIALKEKLLILKSLV